jgi:hypothetical protein
MREYERTITNAQSGRSALPTVTAHLRYGPIHVAAGNGSTRQPDPITQLARYRRPLRHRRCAVTAVNAEGGVRGAARMSRPGMLDAQAGKNPSQAPGSRAGRP